jgi:hypothetical protein
MTEQDPLIDLVASVSGEEYLKVEEDLGDGYVRLRVSEAERRQAEHDIRGIEDVVVELLRNSRDAHAKRVFVATTREGDLRTLVVLDDGAGVPAHLQDRIFEPRVTSKLDTMTTDRWGVHGRGMALFSVRSNVKDALLVSAPHRGLAIQVVADVEELGERADQSTWPVVEDRPDGPDVVRGPHNIVRRVVEFACDHPDVDVYFGSPTEIVATMCAAARDTLEASELMFADDDARFPLWQRPAASADAVELVEVAEQLGLEISERTAHRILSSELAPLDSVWQHAVEEEEPEAEPTVDIYKDRRSVRIHDSDLEDFKRELQNAFDALSERYYLHLKGEPRVTVAKNEIRVRFQIEKED